MYRIFVAVVLLTIFIGFNACESKKAAENQTVSIDVLPFPNKVLKRGGNITLASKIWIIANVSDSLSSALATSLAKRLNIITGEDIRITDLYSVRKHQQSVKLELDNNILARANEAYTLDITSSQIKIKARSAHGIFYGMQTFLQLLKSGANDGSYILPKVVIKDSPTYLVRGITIKQSQLNMAAGPSFFRLLGVLKINSVFVIKDADPEQILKAEASENYIKIFAGHELPNDITLISYGALSKELEEIYHKEDIGFDSRGIVLDLTSTSPEDLISKLTVLAEMSWSDRNKDDFLRVARLTKGFSASK